jgi:MoxR-like ATPase
MEYVFSERIILAINVAMAAGRPLLVRGSSGVGKSSLARSVAAHLDYSYFETVVTSRMEARDFLWRIDHVRRLRDAQAQAPVDNFEIYTSPGPLFWAFDPKFACDLLRRTGRQNLIPLGYIENAAGALVLIDEIDKAEPDVPNSLLEPLGLLSFEVDDLGLRVKAEKPPVIIITTNEERDLPQAFLRRCVEIEIEPPDAEQLVRIGLAHFPAAAPAFLSEVANLVMGRVEQGGRAASAAEYLDTLRSCYALEIDATSEAFRAVAEATMWKSGRTQASGL